MDKVLKVKKSFLGTDVNDIFEYDKENNTYELNKNHTYSQVEDGNPYTVKSSYEVSLSADNINDLINKGYLVPVKDDNKKAYVNIFDKIDELINLYISDLKNIDEDMKNAPACLKIEKQTVLENLVQTLESLKQYKY